MKEFGPSGPPFRGSFIVDRGETILGFDEAMEQLTGWPACDVVGRHKELTLPGNRAGVGTARTVPLYEGAAPVEVRSGKVRLALHCRDGRRLDVEAHGSPLNGPGERTLVNVVRVNATSTRRSNPVSAKGRDETTGLLDRQTFVSRLTSDLAGAAEGAHPLSLIVLDVDHLRRVNDRDGRDRGDAVLRVIAGILRETVGDHARVARIGDDDFAVLLKDRGRGDARQTAAAIRSAVERTSFTSDPSNPRVTVSLGAASFPADADSPDELIERAHDALEEARAMGRNRVWCYMRRPRIPLQVPVYFDGGDSSLFGYARDVSPSGLFVQTTAGIEVGMRCALAFPLPGHDARVHVVGRVVRTVAPQMSDSSTDVRIPGVGIEFERFGGRGDRRAIDSFLHGREETTLRPEDGKLSVGS